MERLVGLPLAPHYAAMSLGGYRRALADAWPGELVFVAGFHDHPAFITAVAGLIETALGGFEPERLFFTAHSPAVPDQRRGRSLPGPAAQLLPAGGGAPRAPALGVRLPVRQHHRGALARPRPAGGGRAIRRPAGSGLPDRFVADHLEILYDLDVEAQEFARSHGLEIRRTASFNDRPEFVTALAAVVEDALAH